MLNKNGTELVTSCPYSPEMNGIAERSNRTVQELARTALLDSGLPQNLWAESVQYVVYCLNITTICPSTGKSAFETIYGFKPKLANMRPFGTKCYMCIQPRKSNKWAPRGNPVHLVGYDGTVDSFRLYEPDSRTVKRSKNVVFL